MTSLQNQAISSVKWTSLKTVISGITGTLLLVIKAKFLSPEEFGYIAVILIVVGLFQLFEGMGISQAIIQRDKISVKESSSLLYFNIFLSCFFALIVYLSSPYVAAFFSEPELVNYLPVVAFVIIASGPSLIFRAFLQKNLHFKQLTIVEIIKNLVLITSTTAFLFFGFGIYGVIFGQIISVSIATILVIIISYNKKSIRIALYFNYKSLIPFWRFGLFVTAKELFTYITHRLDEILIGYFLTPDILGIYHFGKNMLEKLRQLITSSFGRVLFPVISKLKHNKKLLTLTYLKISRYIALGAFPIFIGIAITAHLFVPLVFGEQWIDSIVVFRVFSIAIIFMTLTANVASSLLYSVNRPEVVLYIDVFTNIFYFITLILFIDYGVMVILLAYSSYVVYKTLLLQYYANRQLLSGFLSYFKQLFVPLISSIALILFVLLFQFIFHTFVSNLFLLIGSILIGGFIYGIVFWIIDKNTIREVKLAFFKGRIS